MSSSILFAALLLQVSFCDGLPKSALHSELLNSTEHMNLPKPEGQVKLPRSAVHTKSTRSSAPLRLPKSAVYVGLPRLGINLGSSRSAMHVGLPYPSEPITCATMETPPILTTIPQTLLYFRSGMTFSLHCEATGHPTPSFIWVKDGQDLAGQTGATLEIKDATDLDKGVYRCKARNPFGTAISPYAYVKLAYSDPAGLTQPREYVVTEGHSITFPCSVGASSPPASLGWMVKQDYYDPYPAVVHTNNRVITDDDGNLYFTNLVPSDASEEQGQLYQCVAFNYLTDTTRGGSYVHLSVQPAPVLEDIQPSILHTSPLQIIGVMSETVRLYCIFGGYPTPAVVWRKLIGPFPQKHAFFGSNTTLDFYDIDDSHYGKYTCTGYNRAGSFSLELKVVKRQRPYWITKPFNQVADEGWNALLSCRAAGIPEPSFAWFHNGEKIDGNNIGPRRSIESDGSLIIRNVVPDDMGTYQCNQSNEYGFLFAEATLKVRCVQASTSTTGPPQLTCPQGFVKNEDLSSCYKFIATKEALSWFEADHFCTLYETDRWAKNVHLVAIESAEEQGFLQSQIAADSKISGQQIWTSGNNLDSNEASFRWGRNLEEIVFSAWAPDKPAGAGSCVLMDPTVAHRWDNVACSQKISAVICESDLIRM